MTGDNGDPQAGIKAALERLYPRREALVEQAREVEGEIQRYEAALGVLTGELTVRSSRKGARTTGIAILAALNSFSGPVHTSALLNHDDLVNYSRNALRSALGELKRSGQLTPVERTPHGYIWPGGRTT